MPAPSSWGRNGYNEHWVNAKTSWMWRPLHEAAARMRQAVLAHRDPPAGSLEDRTLRQAGRELMLAQASDWPFIITDGSTEEYARRPAPGRPCAAPVRRGCRAWRGPRRRRSAAATPS